MSSIYAISEQRAKAMIAMPEELPGRPSGWAGAPLHGGRLGSEFEHNVTWRTPRSRALIIGKMMRTSAPLALAEEYLTGRITAVPLIVQRGEGKSDEAADALEQWLGLGKYMHNGSRLGDGMACDDLLRHAMSARTYGHVALSESYEYDDTAGLFWCSLSRRRQESYDAYLTERRTNRLAGIVQRVGYVSGGIDNRVLPINQTFWLVHRPDLGWYDGRSVLRSVYPHFRSEQLRYRLEDLAANRWAAPPMQGSLDVEAFAQFANTGGQPVTRDMYQDEISRLVKDLRNLDSSSDSHLLHPSWWSFSTVTDKAGSYNPEALLRSAEHHQRVMMERLYISFLSLGRSGSGGSYNMASVQHQVILDATIDCLQWFCTAFNRQTVRRFLRANFSQMDPKEYPSVSFQPGAIKVPWWQSNAQSFAQFVSQGIITMSEQDERAIRAASDLPAPDEDTLPDALDRQAQNAGGRLKVPAGQRESRRPGESRKASNPYVNRLIEREGDE